MFKGDASRRGEAVDGPDGQPVLRWRYQAGAAVPNDIAISGGLVFAISDDGILHELDESSGIERWRASTGAELWRFDVDGGNDCCIAIADGMVFVGTLAGGIYAIGGDGSPAAVAPASPAPSSGTPSSGPASASPSSSIVPGAAFSPVWSTSGVPGGLDFPNDLALDGDGRLWVADTGHDRFVIFSDDGRFLETWGAPGRKPGEFRLERGNGDGYGAIEFAPDGSFYVLDVGNRRVQHFGPDRTFLGEWGSFGDGPGEYLDPVAMVVDSDGIVWIADDQRDVVERYAPDGEVLGSFTPHLDDAVNSMALGPDGLVYIAACCTVENHVAIFGADGSPRPSVGRKGTGPGLFADQPMGVAVDAEGHLFVTQGPEAPAMHLQVFDAQGTFLGSWDGDGSATACPMWATASQRPGSTNEGTSARVTPHAVQRTRGIQISRSTSFRTWRT